MKIKNISIILLIILMIFSLSCAVNFTPEDTYNSVVVVYTPMGVGSGFAIEENLIITNAHVVDNNKNVKINLYDGTLISGKVVKSDDNKDLALVKIDQKLVPLEINSDSLSIAQEVYAVGAPKDMAYTITKGIISALDRKIGTNSYVQVDASINSGNSGGPLLDENGKVIGVITLKAVDAEGIGFAIKVEDVLKFIENSDELTNEDNTNDSVAAGTPEDIAGDEEYKNILRQNEILKIVIIILSIFLVLSILIILKLIFKRKKKDEFDFEIEIEE